MRTNIIIDKSSVVEKEDGLYFTGRMIAEGWGNDDFYRYSQLKKTVDPEDKWAGLPITLEHVGGVGTLSRLFKVGEVLGAFSNDAKKELLCRGVLRDKKAIKLFREGKIFLSMGISFWRFLMSAFSIDPNHLSLVSNPASKVARILSKQNNKKFSEENMNEEELKAFAEMAKSIQDKFESLSEEENAKVMSYLEELARDAEPVSDELAEDDGSKDAKIAELEERIAKLEEEKSKSEGELSKTKKKLGVLSLNVSKAKTVGILSSDGSKPFTMNIKK